jgi:hypothetical protein
MMLVCDPQATGDSCKFRTDPKDGGTRAIEAHTINLGKDQTAPSTAIRQIFKELGT